MSKQKSFNYQFITQLNELNFFVNNTNISAFNALLNANYEKLFLYGPDKSGKSFLAQIWLKKNQAVELKNNTEYIITNQKNVLIDEITNFDQENLFYIINNSILNKSKILITSNKKINEINFQFNDLSSRLKTFNIYEIYKPNDEMLITILTKLLTDKQFIVNSNDIFEYILRRVDRSYKGIYDIVDKLDVLSLEKKRQLTIPLIKEIL